MKKMSFESSLPLCFHKLSISFPITQLFPFTFNITAHDRCLLCFYKEVFLSCMFLRCCLIVTNYGPKTIHTH
jgi:hypothetical protein